MKPTSDDLDLAPDDEALPHLDVFVPDGCPLCDGPMHLRLTPDGARSLCRRCEYLAAPEVTPSEARPGRYELTFVPDVEA